MSDVISKHHLVATTVDPEFAEMVRGAFAKSDAVDLRMLDKPLSQCRAEDSVSDADIMIVDLDDCRLEELEALQRFRRRGTGVPVIVVVKEYDAAVVRMLVQMQISDFLTKPVKTADLVRGCARAMKGPAREDDEEAEIYAFLPAAGGVGNTTIAIQTACILHRSSIQATSTCIVDLNLQFGSCAEYLDIEPRFIVSEVENQIDRLDQQLLEAMLSKHDSGISVLAAPASPTDMRTFHPELVIRVLDLVSAFFDNVIIDMPRNWFPWTQTVLQGANRTFITAEPTVPCLRHTQRLLHSIDTEIGSSVKPTVIVNRFSPTKSENGIDIDNITEIFGERYAGSITNNYKLVRDAVDRGVPVHQIEPQANVINDLKRIMLPEEMVFEKTDKRSQFAIPFVKRLKKSA